MQRTETEEERPNSELVIGSTQAWLIAHDGVHGHQWHRWSHGELSDDWIILHR